MSEGPSEAPGKPGFAELDALLDQALDLAGDARDAFLRELPENHREPLMDLLARAETEPLTQMAEHVSRAMGQPAIADRFAGNWRLVRELGSGGMGQVWFAVREEGGFTQQAAIKILWAHRANEDLRSRFFRERRILAGLDHPGLARFLDGGLMADGLPWFAMEYVEGEDLLAWAGRQPLDRRLALMADICETVQFAHEHLVIHRDIKPANILVDAGGRARLLDFGVAAMVEGGREDLLTGPEGSPITLQYASPEQVSGALVSVASDVYQLGMVLYHLTYGQPPYTLARVPLKEAIATICDGELAVPDQGAAPADMASIALKALSKAPAQRYPSAGALGQDIRRFLAGEPVAARPRTAFYVASRFVRRHAAASALTALFVVGLTAATFISLHLARDAREAADRSDRARRILASVMEQADPFQQSGAAAAQDATLTDALINAEARIAEQLGGDNRLTAEIYLELGKMFSRQSLLAEELRSYRAALAAATRLGSEGRALRLTAVAGLGNALVRQDPEQAAAFFDAELPPTPPGGPLDDPLGASWVAAQYAQINALLRIRRTEDADRVIGDLNEAAGRYGLKSPQARARLSNLMASRAARAGNRETADGHWREALTAMREADNPYGLAVMLSNYGIHLGRGGEYDASEAAFRESVTIFEDHAPNDAGFGSVLRTYAGLKVRTGDAEQAVQLLERSRRVLRETGEHYSRFTTLLNLSSYALVADRRLLSLTAGLDGLTLALNRFGPQSDAVQRMIPQLARALSANGLPERALDLVFSPGMVETPGVAQAADLAGLALDAGRFGLATGLLDPYGQDQAQLVTSAAALALVIRLQLLTGQLDQAVVWSECVDADLAGSATAQQLARAWATLAREIRSGTTAATLWGAVEEALALQSSAFFDTLDRQRLRAAAADERVASDVPAARLEELEAALTQLGAAGKPPAPTLAQAPADGVLTLSSSCR